MAGMYLGNASDLASNMGSMFGGTGGNTIIPRFGNFQQAQQQPTQDQRAMPPPMPQGQSGGMNPLRGSGQQQPMANNSGPYNPLAPQAIRPTSFGKFDPQYGQNLATNIGQAFQRPQSSTPLQFNPYGNLGDANVSYPSLGGGNAPLQGLPSTLLQWAQMFNPTALGTNNPTITSTVQAGKDMLGAFNGK
jgi:hypothetical protein